MLFWADLAAEFKGRARARTRRMRLRALERCRFRHIQAAVDRAKTNDRIQIMPGVYREEPSRRAVSYTHLTLPTTPYV